jgi:hypothetical protein
VKESTVSVGSGAAGSWHFRFVARILPRRTYCARPCGCALPDAVTEKRCRAAAEWFRFPLFSHFLIGKPAAREVHFSGKCPPFPPHFLPENRYPLFRELL